MINASLKNHRISPRKVRLVADMVRGKSVAEARNILSVAGKRAKHPLAALLESAAANAKNNFKIDDAKLMVKEIRVDQGVVMKRFRPVSRGSAHSFKRRTSHVSIVLAPIEETKGKRKTEKGKIDLK